MIRQGLWLALIIALRKFHAPLPYVVGARVAVATVEAVLIWSASRRFFSANAAVLWHQAPHYLKESFPVAISSLLAGVYLRIDQVMLHNMVNDRALGQYAAAVKVSELLETAPAALLYSIAPILSVAVGSTASISGLSGADVSLFECERSGLVRGDDGGSATDN